MSIVLAPGRSLVTRALLLNGGNRDQAGGVLVGVRSEEAEHAGEHTFKFEDKRKRKTLKSKN